MDVHPLSSDRDLNAIRALMERNASRLTIVDFEEVNALATVLDTLRLWKHNGQLVGFAYVDDFNNLWFETDSSFELVEQLGTDIVAWGVTCIRQRNAATGEVNTLDSTCDADNAERIRLLTRHGFVQQAVRTLRYARSLDEPIVEYPLPAGFFIRCVRGREEVDALVALHRAAFGTDHMTVERRLALMSAPHYRQDLDLVAVAPNSELAAFCICGFEDPHEPVGYTDPIGVHPNYQRIGLGKAIVTAGLLALKEAGACAAQVGTSSENVAMQALAESLQFKLSAEKLWFSKVVS